MTSFRAIAGGLVDGFNKSFDQYQDQRQQQVQRLHGELELALKARDRNAIAAISQKLNGPDFQEVFKSWDEEKGAKRYGSLMDLAKSSGGYEAAAGFIPDIVESRNQMTGRHDVGPKLIPEQASGPVQWLNPDMTPREKAPIDYSNPANRDLITSLTQFAPPAPPKPQTFDLAPGHSRYKVGPDGRPVLDVTAPTVEKPTPAKEPRLVQDPTTGQWFEPRPGMKTGVKAPTPTDGDKRVKAVNTQNYFATVNYLINKYGAKVTSAGRSTEEQAALYAAAVKKYGKANARKYAAPPGSSYHEKKDAGGNPLAHDIYVDPKHREAFISEARSLGLDIGSHYGDGHIHTEPLDGAVIPKPPTRRPEPKPKEVKPFDEVKADKIVRNELGIRQGRRIPPTKQAEYDKRIEQRKKAHEASGGVSQKEAFFDFLEQEL